MTKIIYSLKNEKQSKRVVELNNNQKLGFEQQF